MAALQSACVIFVNALLVALKKTKLKIIPKVKSFMGLAAYFFIIHLFTPLSIGF